MAKDTLSNPLGEEVVNQGRILDDRLQVELQNSMVQCHSWVKTHLEGQAKSRMEHKIRKRMEESLEASMIRKVEEALNQLDAALSR